ncbi:MAG TPA: site-2 protease family protein [Acidimicrobiia bacterium]|nr:site-2 protease family protein [Acidimicrobiia bacterium]
MRVSDPFETADIGVRKAVIVAVGVLALFVLYAIVYPTQTALVAMILAFFVMIMLHELGHFLTAKRAGMKVTEFFVGFGPRLWSFRKGETEYGVKAVPLGGYCRIIGMTNVEEVAPEDEPRAYRSRRWGAKVGVAAAGPAVHFLIALVLMFVVIFFAGDYRNQKATTTLAQVTQGAQAAGLQPGDQVLAIDGTRVTGWSQVPNLVNPPSNPAKPGETRVFTVRRGDASPVDIVVTLQASTDPGSNGRVVAGIAPQVVVPHPGVLASIARAPREVGDFAWSSIKAIGGMFSPSGIANYFHLLAGDTGKNVNQQNRFVSPVGFGKLASDAVRSGWVDAVGLLIMINIFVGLFNLLPLLPFDGGHIAIASYERIASAARGRRVQVDVNKLMPITAAVVAIFGFIFLSSLFLDITRPIANPF